MFINRRVLSDNKWRYASMIAGFFLFVAPFALFTRVVYDLTGNSAEPTLHTICLRMPIDWLFGGRYYSLIGNVAAVFILGVVLLAFFASPLFCGWLCPVGAVSESVSRAVPIPDRLRLKVKDPRVTRGLRFGFLTGFILVAVFAGYKLVEGVASVCCRYCASSVLQNISYGATGNLAAIEYWQSGSIISLGFWLLIGGVFFAGGRGWCLFFCPVGALSGISHKIGSRLGFYSVMFDKEACKNCAECNVNCPTWAVGEDKSVEKTLCVGCQECTHACNGGAYSFKRGKADA